MSDPNGRSSEREAAAAASAAVKKVLASLHGVLDTRHGFLFVLIDLPTGMAAMCGSDVSRAMLVSRLRVMADNLENGRMTVEQFDPMLPLVTGQSEGRA